MIVLKIFGMCMALLTFTKASLPKSDSCDWTGSGTLEMALSRSVQPVYLRCNQGTVRWYYPQGALRIVLQNWSTGNEFRACLKKASNFSGGRIYLSGPNKLFPIFRASDNAEMIRCVTSRGSQIALYVEADGTQLNPTSHRVTLEFNYHLKKLRNAKAYPEECQPCADDQLIRQYCTSDFVIQGEISNLQHNVELQQTELTVQVVKFHRVNEISKFAELDSNLPGKYVILKRPLLCGTKTGLGQYLFMGNWMLGNPSLNCIPRIREWKKIRRKSIKNGTNECILKL